MEKSEENAVNNEKEEDHEDEIVTKEKLQQLVQQVCVNIELDEQCEDMLREISEDFVKMAVNGGCLIAKHRNSSTLEVEDVKLFLERRWKMKVPFYGTGDSKVFDPEAPKEDGQN